jgi:iron-sulfur cluster assembly protein
MPDISTLRRADRRLCAFLDRYIGPDDAPDCHLPNRGGAGRERGVAVPMTPLRCTGVALLYFPKRHSLLTETMNPMTMPETTPEPTPAMPAPSSPLVTLTDAAAAKVVELRSREGKDEAALRLFVKSGGCSGYSYGLAFDDRVAEDDRLETHGEVKVVIDAFSVQHVDGAEIDYVDSLMGSGFAINNPNAVSSCACGSSFNTDGSPARAGGCH